LNVVRFEVLFVAVPAGAEIVVVIGGDGDAFLFTTHGENGGTNEGNKRERRYAIGNPFAENWRELTWGEPNLGLRRLVFCREFVKNNRGYWLGEAGLGFGGFQFAITRRRGGFEGSKEAMRCGGDFADGEVECGGVGFGWLVKARDFADELKRSGADLVGSDGRIKIEKRFDAAAHFHPPRED